MALLSFHVDKSMPLNEEIRFKKKYKRFMVRAAKTSGFTYNEIVHIMLIYYKVAKTENRELMTRKQLMSFLHHALDITDYRFMECITAAIDDSFSKNISVQKWVDMMALFLKGTLEDKIKYVFKVYTCMGKKHDILERTQMANLLKPALINEEDEEAAKDLVEILMKRMDNNESGDINIHEFRRGVLSCPNILQMLGTVLPSRLATKAFASTFKLADSRF